MYSPEIEALYALVVELLPDNVTGEITPARARQVLGGLLDYVGNLNTNQVKGSVFRVPFVANVAGLATVPTVLIPPRSRILGMDVRAINGTDATSTAAGVRAEPIDFRLIAYPTGTIDALVDEQATTTTTIKARWVRTSGSDEQKRAYFSELIPEDHNYLKGEVVYYVFPNGATRLLQWRANSVSFTHPVPTGADDDPIYAPFALAAAAAGGVSQQYVDDANAEQQGRLNDHETRIHELEGDIVTLENEFYDYIDTLQTGTTPDEKNRIAGRYIISTAGVVRTYGVGGTALNTALASLVSGETFSFAHGGRQTSTLPPSGRLFDGITVLGHGFVWSVGTSSYGYLAMLNCMVWDLTIQGTAGEYAYMSGANSRFNNCDLFYVTAVTMNAAQTAMVPNAVIRFSGSRLNFVRYPAAFTVEYLNGTVSTNESRLNGNGANSGVKVRYQATLPDTDGTYALQVAAGVYTYAPASAGGGATGIDYTNPVAHTAAATLTAGDMNKLHTVSGANAFTLLLPAAPGPVGTLLRVQVLDAATAVYTLDGNGKLIGGEATRVLWAGESPLLRWDGTAWVRDGGVLKPMTAKLSTGGEGTFATPGYGLTGIPYSTEIFRIGPPGFVHLAGNRLIVQRKGIYEVEAYVSYSTDLYNNDLELLILANGAVGSPKTVNYLTVVPAKGDGSIFTLGVKSGSQVSYDAGDAVDVRIYSEVAGAVLNAGNSQARPTLTLVEQLTW